MSTPAGGFSIPPAEAEILWAILESKLMVQLSTPLLAWQGSGWVEPEFFRDGDGTLRMRVPEPVPDAVVDAAPI